MNGVTPTRRRMSTLARRFLAGSTAAALALVGANLIVSGASSHIVVPDSPSPAEPTVVTLAASGPAIVTVGPAVPSAATTLDQKIHQLGDHFRGDLGLAVRDVQTGWSSHYRGLDSFPQQSVSKLWVALSVLDRADRGALDMASAITLRRDDLTLFHQPISALALRPGGFRTTPEDLLVRALTQSDNSANDRLLQQVGGPDAVREMLARKGIAGIRFGPGERLLQSRIAGLDWKPAYAVGGAFYAARDALSDGDRKQAFDAYLANPADGATPLAIVDTLARLKQGQLLSAASTEHMLAIMSHTHTGPMRLKGGLRPGWALSHKTGTGQILDGEQAGYNDVGILTSPDGRSYAIAVLIGRTSRPLPERMALMQKLVEATIDYDAKLARQRAAHPANDTDPCTDCGVTHS